MSAMMDLTEVAVASGGRLSAGSGRFTGVSTDSRTVAPGDLFVALKGERFDGHGFVAEARKRGAAAALVEASALRTGVPVEWAGLALVVVPDTRQALGKLAAYWRAKFTLPLVALTGSNGKTTVKEMLATILKEAAGEERVLATRGNLNNDIGVPLTLLGLRAEHRYGVIEMGMNHPGEIAYLTAIANPEVGLVTNAGPAHLEGLGSVEAVARAKGELFAGLKPEAVAVINADDTYAPLWRALAGGRRMLEFGLVHAAAVSADYRLEPNGAEIRLRLPRGTARTRLAVPGVHNVRNALAAAAAAAALEIEAALIGRGLERFRGVPGRLMRVAGLNGATLIDDTYNANPDSVRAALSVLAAAPGKKVLVLGDMGELGGEALRWHEEIGAAARGAGVERLYTLGRLSEGAARAFGAGARHFERIEDLLAEVENQLAPEVTVLIKGSRFMEMERVVKSMRAPCASCGAG